MGERRYRVSDCGRMVVGGCALSDVTLPLSRVSDNISLLALAVSFFALAWNIIRDLIIDRVKIHLSLAVGKLHSHDAINGKALFINADEAEAKTISNPYLLSFTVTNIGRRSVVIAKIAGRFKLGQEKPQWIWHTKYLPIMINPYDRHFEFTSDKDAILQMKAGDITDVWAEDTKGKKWHLSGREWSRLRSMLDALPAVF